MSRKALLVIASIFSLIEGCAHADVGLCNFMSGPYLKLGPSIEIGRFNCKKLIGKKKKRLQTENSLTNNVILRLKQYKKPFHAFVNSRNAEVDPMERVIFLPDQRNLCNTSGSADNEFHTLGNAVYQRLNNILTEVTGGSINNSSAAAMRTDFQNSFSKNFVIVNGEHPHVKWNDLNVDIPDIGKITILEAGEFHVTGSMGSSQVKDGVIEELNKKFESAIEKTIKRIDNYEILQEENLPKNRRNGFCLEVGAGWYFMENLFLCGLEGSVTMGPFRIPKISSKKKSASKTENDEKETNSAIDAETTEIGSSILKKKWNMRILAKLGMNCGIVGPYIPIGFSITKYKLTATGDNPEKIGKTPEIGVGCVFFLGANILLDLMATKQFKKVLVFKNNSEVSSSSWKIFIGINYIFPIF